MKALVALLFGLILTRTYWPVDATKFATSGSYHTHVQITGYVTYLRREDDGDLHIRVVPTAGSTDPYFIAECIPLLPCVTPAIGQQVTIQGITRRDPEHGWWEIHPVEHLSL